MSHKKLRTKNNCLNCGSVVEECFCSACGQENLELQDSAFHLVLHYFQDLFHYDGKFWYTITHFIRKPGLVPADFMTGKRKSHLNPVQFYVFASTIFFLALFMAADPSTDSAKKPEEDYKQRIFHLEQERKMLAGTPDTMYVDRLIQTLETLGGDSTDIETESEKAYSYYSYNPQLDSTEAQSWLGKMLKKRIQAKTDEMNSTYAGNNTRAVKGFLKDLLHALPQLFFLSMPFFALILLILYMGTMRSNYVANFIFSIYQYAYLYIIALVYLLATGVKDMFGSSALDTIWGWVTVAFIGYPLVYLYLAMKRFYRDKGITLVMRFISLLFLFTIVLIVLFLIVTFFTFII